MIRLLIVEDSPVLRDLLIHIFGADPAIQIIGIARDGEEAVEAVASRKPDVITMDIHMPKLDGFEATRKIMETHPTPIVIVSGSTDPHDVAVTFHAIDAGALALMRRPAGVGHPDHEESARELVRTVKLMSEVRVIRRWPRRKAVSSLPPETLARTSKAPVKVVAIGASTGGPPVLQTVLSALAKDFPLPILVVQHMAPGFTEGFAGWLAQTSAVRVRLAVNGETIRPAHVYVAPDDRHMKVKPDGTIRLTTEEPESGLRPSVASLFRSVIESYGAAAVAGLLTGMGRDGADELKLLREQGAVTFAQDKASSVVHGMPGEAIRMGAATYVLSPDGIAAALMTIANQRR